MRDDPTRGWFPADDEPRNPMKAAQAAMRPALPKRFYKTAEIEEREGAFQLVLDGRPARTPAKNPIAVPTRALGEALSEEWNRQGAEIDPSAMPVTRIVNSAVDGVAPRREAVIADIAKYAGSDLVCYRADEPERLVADQAAAWDPVLSWARETLGAQFFLSEGIVHVEQPRAAIDAVRARLEETSSPFALAALHVMTTLTGSVLIALAHAAGRLDAHAAWAAAHVDERHQESLWGEDDEALRRRAAREAEFQAASRVYALSA
jgi:chaperone required for assembly of F1-ATPase